MQRIGRGARVSTVLVDSISAPVTRMSRAPAVYGGFDDFVRAQQLALVRYATLLTGSQQIAEDLVQDVLARVYPRWDALAERTGDVAAYVRRAVTNEHISWRRRWSTRHVLLSAEGQVPDVAIAAADPVGDDGLWQRLLALPPKQRTAIVLRFYEDVPDADIAAILGCRITTVRSTISRGLAALRRNLDHEEGMPDA